jgi:hypothetical protein
MSQKMLAELQIFYEKTALYSIDEKLRKQLYKVADDIVDQYMRKTDIKTVFIQKASEDMKDDVIVIQMKAKLNN